MGPIGPQGPFLADIFQAQLQAKIAKESKDLLLYRQ